MGWFDADLLWEKAKDPEIFLLHDLHAENPRGAEQSELFLSAAPRIWVWVRQKSEHDMPSLFVVPAAGEMSSWVPRTKPQIFIEGSLEVKLPTIWTVEKQRWEESEEEDADARKDRKVAKHCVFPMIWGSGGSKSRLAKAAGAEPAGQMRHEKVHAVVARSTFPSQNGQNTRGSDHFWKLRCRKSARRCGAKHIWKSKCTKHTNVGPLLEVQMSKKCTPLWREAHFQVKMYKTHQCRTTFGSSDVEKVHAVVVRSTFPSQNVKNTRGSDHFWRFRCRKSVEKVHAVVARSTFRSQKCKKLRVLSLFWREDVEKVDTD